MGFSFNKALVGGVSAGVLSAFLPALLGMLHMIEPVAAGINPILGLFVGAVTAVLTWLTKNKTANT